MKKNTCLTARIKPALCGGLLAALTGVIFAQPSLSPARVEASISVGLPSVEIHTESDFYEPLAVQGEWVVIGSYGRCWRPARVERDWRPYCNGNWERTEAGWYWASDEPWAWATYHYGRWDFNDRYGWYWVPQTQWAPAWVSWHRGGGYFGWAPLSPSARIAGSALVEVDVRVISPRAFVFVEERRFLEPVRPKTVIVNNTTIINKTVNITNVKVVNNTVINEGPQAQVIEQVSGRKIQEVPVRELRRKQEAPVVARQKAPAANKTATIAQAPVPTPNEVESRVHKAAGSPAAVHGAKSAAASDIPAALPINPAAGTGAKENRERPGPQVEPRPSAPRPVGSEERAVPNSTKYAPPLEPPARGAEKKAPGKPARPDKEKPAPGEKKGRPAGEQGHKQNADEHPTPPEKSSQPPGSP